MFEVFGFKIGGSNEENQVVSCQSLVKKYKQNKQFKAEMDEGKKKYYQIVQESFYASLQIIPQNILQKFPNEDIDIYFYYGYMQPKGKQNLRKLMMHFFKNFNTKVFKPYIFVYFNNNTSDNQYNEFRQIFMMLTLQHFQYLKEFLVVRSSFMMRAFQYITFGALNKYIKVKTVFIENGKQLCQKLGIDEQTFINFIPDKIYQNEKECFANLEKGFEDINQHRINITGQTMSEQQKKLRNSHQQQLLSFMHPTYGKQTHQIKDYQLSKIGIPLVLQLLIFYFKSNPSSLLLEGLFRKSVSIEQENDILKKLSLQNYQCISTIKNPHIVANLVKRFFSKLKTPLIPFQQFQMLMHDQKLIGKIQYIKSIIQKLPQTNLLTLINLLQFLIKELIPKQSENKMNTKNVSICFSPCIMRAKIPSTADILYSIKSTEIFQLFLNDFQKIFGNEKYIKELFRTPFLKTKQFLRDAIEGNHPSGKQINDLKGVEKNIISVVKSQIFFDMGGQDQLNHTQTSSKKQKSNKQQSDQKLIDKIQKNELVNAKIITFQQIDQFDIIDQEDDPPINEESKISLNKKICQKNASKEMKKQKIQLNTKKHNQFI